MNNINAFIESGILELYILGKTSEQESAMVEDMASKHSVIRDELDLISEELLVYAQSQTITPNPTIKPFLLATIDFSERMQAGEVASLPPILTQTSRIQDYELYTNRLDMALPAEFKDFHARIIGFTPEALTAIVWISEMAPQEIHDNEIEQFLILEGTCSITIDSLVHYLNPGDFLSIPLHKKHHIRVTSPIPCKAILQRIAA